MPIEPFFPFGRKPPIELAQQLHAPAHLPVWSPLEEALQIVTRGTGNEHALVVPIAVAEDKQHFQMAWDARPERVPLTALPAARDHTVSVGGASTLATHYWVLIWSLWVVPRPLPGRKPFTGSIELEMHTAQEPVAAKSVTLETKAIETALQALWQPDHAGLISVRRRP
jgi:hypothetical protein